MKKISVYAIIAIVLYGFYLNSSAVANNPAITFKREQIIVQTLQGEKTFNTEIAVTSEQLKIGLMYRKTLPENAAMLFIFEDGKEVNMWMKNTLIPLDILFIDKLGIITYIAENAKPHSQDIISAGNVATRAVMELNGGTTKKQHINVGDKVIYKGL